MELKSILITGVAGFIGSNLGEHYSIKYPNARIIGVDNLHSNKFRNLLNINLSDYFHRDNIGEALKSVERFDLILHMGACSDTTETDEEFLISNNFNFSKLLLDYSNKNSSKFIYASSAATYGLGNDFKETAENEKPLNAYGYSKLIFDNYVRERLKQQQISTTIAGLRFFNVFGKNECHKGKMASVIYHFYNQFLSDGKIKIFGNYGGYSNGNHERDFIYVNDIINVIHDLSLKNVSGIFNLGTGYTTTYNNLGVLVLMAIMKRELTLEDCLQEGLIEYIDFPHHLKGKYQCYTKADMTHLIESGINFNPTAIRNAVEEYINILDRCKDING